MRLDQGDSNGFTHSLVNTEAEASMHICHSLTGLGCDLIEEMATNFPNAATNLLNISPQASRHIQVRRLHAVARELEIQDEIM